MATFHYHWENGRPLREEVLDAVERDYGRPIRHLPNAGVPSTGFVQTRVPDAGAGPRAAPANHLIDSTEHHTLDAVLDQHLRNLRQIAKGWASKVTALETELEGSKGQRDLAVQRLKDFELELAKRAAGR